MLWRYIFIAAAPSIALFALDYYVYRNWRRFVRCHQQTALLPWLLPLYRLFMFLMPLTLPAYFYLFRWWEVEPKLLRAAFFSFWALYYLPKMLIAFGLLIKDIVRFVIWLFGWFQDRLSSPSVKQPSAVDAPVGPKPGLDLSDMKRMSRSEFLHKMGWTAAAVPYVVIGYGVFRDLYDFDVRRVTVPVSDLPRALEGLTIAHLSDLHAGSFFSEQPVQEAVALTNSLRPDLIVFTGDYVNHDARELPRMLPALKGLKAGLGAYGCLGNHDHYAQVADVVRGVRETPIDLLVNEHRTLDVDGAQLHVIGTDNTGFSQHFADLPGALQGLHATDEEVKLLLAHDPTFWDAEVRPHFPGIDVMLCGHTHGGQIGFELGPMRWSLAQIRYDRWAGLYTEDRPEAPGRQLLYVNRGLGTVGPPLRIGIRPEITLLTLTRA